MTSPHRCKLKSTLQQSLQFSEAAGRQIFVRYISAVMYNFPRIWSWMCRFPELVPACNRDSCRSISTQCALVPESCRWPYPLYDITKTFHPVSFNRKSDRHTPIKNNLFPIMASRFVRIPICDPRVILR